MDNITDITCMEGNQTRRQPHPVVWVKNAYKHYGSDKNPTIIFNNLNMTVSKGTIYGLLGASGCGKTTLLNCIVGRKKFMSGTIWVLGGTPGTANSGIPGPRFGYMPQSASLYGEFTIRETFKFFGWISSMSASKIEEKTDFFIKLLFLPNPDEFIKNLSTGQQRRVSLAAALLHEPELLILDEPTVGLDPLLRESIWTYILQLSNDYNTTVIITTHYINEASQANTVALMRNGQFLAEESPKDLLNRYNLQTLEDAFLRLCNNQDLNNKDYINNLRTGFDNINLKGSITNIHQTSDTLTHKSVFKKKHFKALLWKNLSWMLRNIPIVLCCLVLPFIQTAIFCVSIGNDPKDLVISVTNYENNGNNNTCSDKFTCNDMQLGCHYLKYLDKYNLILVYYDSNDLARQSVLKGEAYASLLIKSNYSSALQNRVKKGKKASTTDIQFSEVDVFRDTSNQLITRFLENVFYKSFKLFIQEYMTACGLESRLLTSLVKIEEPVYGDLNATFVDFAAPGILLTFVSFLSASLTSMAMLLERNEGILERCLVIGISQFEMLMAHGICQSLIMFCQSLITLACIFGVFNLVIKGSMVLVTVITLLTGFFGLCVGLLISCISKSEIPAFMATMGSFVPLIILCGIIWPIEGMHHFLQPIVFFLPLTQTTDSIRSVMQRGWGLSYASVYLGLISISVWILVIVIAIVVVLRFRKE